MLSRSTNHQPAPVGVDVPAVRAVVAAARAAGRPSLLEPEGLALLAAAGIATPVHLVVPGETEVTDAALAAFPGERIVVKVVAASIAHKTDAGGVAIVAREAAAVRGAIAAMRERLAGVAVDGWLLAAFVPHDQGPAGELLLALRWTDDFGPVVAVGAGGILTEALSADLRPGREIAIVSPTLTPAERVGEALDASTAVRLATHPLRGQPPRLDPARLRDAVGRLLALAPLVPDDLAELEINPAAVTADGLVALDVLANLGSPELRATGRPSRPLHQVDRLLRPQRIGIVGVSSGMNAGRVILQNILREGFEPAAVTVIKPGVAELDGVRCVPDLDGLAATGGRVDMLVVVLPAAQTPAFVAEVVERDLAASLIVIPGGFDETDAGSVLAERMRASLAASRERPDGGPVVNGANCLGIRSRPGRYDTLFIPQAKLPPGSMPVPVALITGSGAFAITRLSRLAPLDPRYVITIGNQLDLTAGDLLARLADEADAADEAMDDAAAGTPPGGIRVAGVYLEGFAPLDGAAFARAAARFTAGGRRVILYRAGRTPAGASASAGHTAAIAGDVTVGRELLRAAGVTIAETPAAFDELLRAFTLLDGRPAAGHRLGAVSNAGSECVTIADHAGTLRVAPFAPGTAARLSALLVPAGITSVVDVHNPLDLTPIAGAALSGEVIRAVLAADEVDAGIIGVVPMADSIETLAPGDGHAEDLARPGAIADQLIAAWRATRKPWVCVVDAGPLYAPLAERLTLAGIPVLGTGDAAARALAAWCDATAAA